jgi:hypothetical protein
MRLFRTLAAFVLLSIMLGAPAMACLAPDAQLTEQEKACCREMANQCGDTEMSSDHSCCQKLIIQHHDLAVVKELCGFVVPHVSLHSVSAEASLHLHAATPLAFLPDRLRHPPPEPLAHSTEILRI